MSHPLAMLGTCQQHLVLKLLQRCGWLTPRRFATGRTDPGALRRVRGGMPPIEPLTSPAALS